MFPSGSLVTLKHSTREYAENITPEILWREKQQMRTRLNTKPKVISRIAEKFSLMKDTLLCFCNSLMIKIAIKHNYIYSVNKTLHVSARRAITSLYKDKHK
jgi:hypothetical protein